MDKEKYILFMDSGIGGISILNHFLSIKKDCNIIYYADTINFPYGKISERKIGEILYNVYLNLSDDYSISLINIVCNTASISALKILREKVNIPVVGTVPAIKPATLITKNNKIGIMATETTVKSGYLEKLINEFASDKEVFIKSAPGLVELSEKRNSNKEIKNKTLMEELNYFKEANVDVLVLGCTHYSFLKKEIGDYFQNKVEILDSIEGVTNRIIYMMKSVEYSNNNKRILYLSKGDNGTMEKYQKICNDDLDLFNKIIVEDLSCLKV